jgi:hypothetical protein
MHSRNPGYIAGDHWLVCEICGFDYRKSQMQQTWDGKWVCEKDWEPRHPQDFVTGVPDNQAVQVARPDTTDTFNYTTMSVAAVSGVTSVSIGISATLKSGDGLGIKLDDDTLFWTYLTADQVLTVCALGSPLPSAAAAGNDVYYRGSSFRTTEPTAADL